MTTCRLRSYGHLKFYGRLPYLSITNPRIMSPLVCFASMGGLAKFATMMSKLLVSSNGFTNRITTSEVPTGNGLSAYWTEWEKPSPFAVKTNGGLLHNSVSVAAESLIALPPMGTVVNATFRMILFADMILEYWD